ncbi:DUF3103 family protein [Streptomyces smaragdinus]|uniref:DUF3103 family protein n=1 Tax=Streptomyces smaragdinus TaxID=2585196 RepID=UPI001E4B7B81|nr:DUF3103 family protein [Streptomyces smaragdinus]
MFPQQFRTALVGLTLTGLALTAAPGLASASDAKSAPVRGKSQVSSIEDSTARSLALSLADGTFRSQVARATAGGAEVSLAPLAGQAGSAFRSEVAAADRKVAAAKGLDADTGSLLTVQLAGADTTAAALSATAPLVATAPNDDEATSVTAYDSLGRAHRLDAKVAPEQPVLVVGLDGDKAVSEGMQVLNRELAAAGVATPASTAATTTSTQAAAADGYWTSRVTAVRLSDDQETWIKGNAEIFTVTSGFGLDGKVRVDTVTMPYLDDADHTYYPNQILVNWSLYKYNLADTVMFEDDGDTNYSALAKALASALLTILDLGAYIPLVNPVIDAMPDSFWVDDPDFVDAWYTLSREMTGTRNGAGGHGWMTFDRYFVSAL